jgi:hypothetical protein
MPGCATTSARTGREPPGSGAAPRGVVRPMSALPVRSARPPSVARVCRSPVASRAARRPSAAALDATGYDLDPTDGGAINSRRALQRQSGIRSIAP